MTSCHSLLQHLQAECLASLCEHFLLLPRLQPPLPPALIQLGFFVLRPEGRGDAAASLGTEMGMQGEPSAPDGRSPGPCHPPGGRRGGEEEEEEGRVGLALEPLAGGSARSLLGREGDEGSRAALRGCWWESRTCGGWPLADD